MLRRRRVAEIVDEVVGPRRGDASASVGTHVALAAANRVVAPCPKPAFAEWWATTAGPRFLRLPTGALDRRRSRDATDAPSAADVVAAERRLTAEVVAGFGLDSSGLVCDVTNFAAFVDSANARNTVARRGHAEQKRHDLRSVGLGLVVSRDGGVPVVHHAYAGDRPDVTRFPAVLDEPVARWRELPAPPEELTLVYDAGCPSAADQAAVDAGPLHFVGSVPPSQHPNLLAVPAGRFRPVDEARFPGLGAFEARAEVLGADRRVVVTHSEAFHDRQRRGFAQTLAKATRSLADLAARLERGRTRRPREAVEAEVAEIPRPRWVARVTQASSSGSEPRELRSTWALDPG